jgi:hypothetical protein
VSREIGVTASSERSPTANNVTIRNFVNSSSLYAERLRGGHV